MRRPFTALLVSGILIAVALESRRGYLSFLIWRHDIVRLERWGGDECFVPAVRREYSRAGRKASCRDELSQWATRRYAARFPDDRVMDLAWLPSRELVLLLRRSPDSPIPDYHENSRLVVLDLADDERVVAESEPFENNAWGFDIRYFRAWPGPTFLLRGQGTGESMVILRRNGSTFEAEVCKSGKTLDPLFTCWVGLTLIDRDGVPEVRGLAGKWRNCPACGKDVQGNWVTWKKIDGVYYPWTEYGEECGLACELGWSK